MNKYLKIFSLKALIFLFGIILCGGLVRAYTKLHIDKKLREICNQRVITDANLLEAEDLLNRGADPNQTYISCLPLLVELMGGQSDYNDINHNKLFITLLKHGANPNSKNCWDESTPLLAWGFNSEVELALIKYGARADDQSEGKSVLQSVIERGNNEEIELIQETLKNEKKSNVLCSSVPSSRPSFFSLLNYLFSICLRSILVWLNPLY